MSESLSRAIKTILIASVVVCLALTLPAKCEEHCANFYGVAIRFMRAFYPELTRKSVTVDSLASLPFDVDGPPGAFSISVSESHPTEPIRTSPSPNPSSADRVGHLSGRFQFDGRDHKIFSIFFSGSLANDEKQEALAKLVDAHPEWSDAQMTDALLQAGAKFGPNQKDALLARLPIKELEPILGKIEMGPAYFRFRGNTEPPFYAVMNWSVRFRTTEDGRIDEFTLALEPFNGKVVSFGRRGIENGKQ